MFVLIAPHALTHPKDSAVLGVVLLGEHIDPEESDLGVFPVSGAPRLPVVPRVDDAQKIVERLHLNGHDARATRGSHDGTKHGPRIDSAKAAVALASRRRPRPQRARVGYGGGVYTRRPSLELRRDRLKKRRDKNTFSDLSKANGDWKKLFSYFDVDGMVCGDRTLKPASADAVK